MADVSVAADPITITLSYKSPVWSYFPSGGRNPELDQELSLSYAESTDSLIAITLTGTWLNVGISADPIEITITLYSPDTLTGEVFSDDATLDLQVSVGQTEDGSGAVYVSGPQMVTEASRRNWVKWSDIGYLDFTIGQSNVAGERPMDWAGWVYGIKKLGTKVVVYGQNGVSLLIPSGTSWGLQGVHRLGLKGKHAVCGSDSEHFFVDVEGRLYHLAEQLDKLDYSEYLDSLGSTTVMSYDVQNGLVYICDGDIGYVYCPASKSLGTGPYNVTGIGSQGGSLYIASPATISVPTFEICTDIYDFGTRRAKTIRNVQLGTDNTQDLYVAIDYRRDKGEAFSSTEWRIVNDEGVAYITCYGHEFRIKVKSLTYEYFELDYIKVNGQMHDY